MAKKLIQRSIHLATVGAVSAAALVGGWGWFSHWQESMKADSQSESLTANRVVSPPMNQITSDTKSGAQETASPPKIMTSSVWERSLQYGFRQETPATVAPPKPPMVEAVVQAPPPIPSVNDLGLRLVGTVLEKGRSMAIAIDGMGTLDFRGEGDLLRLQPDGVRIDKVSRDYVLVSYKGESSHWKMGQSLQFQSTAIDNQPAPLIPSSDSDPLNTSSNEAMPKIIPNLAEPPAVMPIETTPSVQPNANTPAKMSIEDELDMLNGSNPLDPL